MPLNLSFIKSVHLKRYALAPREQKPGVVAEMFQMVKAAREYYPRTELVHLITNDGTPPIIDIEFVTGDKLKYTGATLNLSQILKDIKIEQTKLDGILLEREYLEEKEEFEDVANLGNTKKDEKKDGKKDAPKGKEDDKKKKK